MKGRRLKPGEVDLWQRRRYWEVFEKDKIVQAAQHRAAYENGFRTACAVLLSDLRPDSEGYKLAKKKSDLYAKFPFSNAPDVAQEYFDREAPKALQKFMDDGRNGRKVVREDNHGPYKTTVHFF